LGDFIVLEKEGVYKDYVYVNMGCTTKQEFYYKRFIKSYGGFIKYNKYTIKLGNDFEKVRYCSMQCENHGREIKGVLDSFDFLMFIGGMYEEVVLFKTVKMDYNFLIFLTYYKYLCLSMSFFLLKCQR